MLLELNVKDIALIKKASVSYGRGLNIMTGETGAGKSVIIGSCLLCLGGKLKGDVIREGSDSAMTELLFSVPDSEKRQKLTDLGVSFDDGDLLCLQRKITPQRSIFKLNGETVTTTFVRSIAGEFIDIYGQNEYHTLLDHKNHLEILDNYIGPLAADKKASCKEAYIAYRKAKEHFESFTLDEYKRNSEISLIEYEIEEIDRASLIEGEEEELSVTYKKLNNARNIVELLSSTYDILRGFRIQNAIRDVEDAMHYDASLKNIFEELSDAGSILSDAEGEISAYVDEMDLAGDKLSEVEARLDLIRTLERKYGKTVADIGIYREKREQRLEELRDYEENKLASQKEMNRASAVLKEKAEELSALRQEAAPVLCDAIRKEMLELAFTDVKVELRFTETAPQENGADEVTFYAALNPGEAVKPVAEVASGGELSRLMLSIKTVLSGKDGAATLIFDEIDTGISGRTAQKVAEKLAQIAKNHQVICITHLPQIAAMADTHFVIEKNEEEGRNVTRIRELGKEESEEELARLLGGATLTDAALENAREMKRLAENYKEST